MLGAEKLGDILAELSSPQIKAILKQGGIKLKAHGGYVSQQVRKRQSAEKILAALTSGDDGVASELLQQWLLHHRRAMLIDYLNELGVKHRDGETDDTFLINTPRERIQDGAAQLVATHDRQEVLAYLHYIAYQQKSPVFEDWTPPAAASSGPGAEPPVAATP